MWLLLACGGAPAEPPAPPAAPPPAPASARSVAVQPGPELRGLCDASAAVALRDWLVVADDERNLLHVFAPDGTPDQPVILDLDADKESDLEGMAVVDDRVWVIASHDSGKGTERKPDRQRFLGLAVEAGPQGVRARVTDGPVRTLLAHPPLSSIAAATAGHTSKDPAGLSIEGLAAGPGGSVLVGFRAPVLEGMALVVQVDDPITVAGGAPPRISPPKLLDLGGRGVRSLEADGEGWLGVAGPPDGGDDFALFRWDGSAVELLDVDLGDITPEALVRWQDSWWVLSDDGNRKIGGKKCKELPPGERRARTARLSL